MIKVENLCMRTLATLKEEGKKVAFINGNRKTEDKNISSKKKSLKEFNYNIVPLMYVSGTKAVEDGCKLVDADTKVAVKDEDAINYIVIIDGQHRYIAAIRNEMSTDNIILYENYTEANTKDLLAIANRDSKPWDSSNYINGAVLFDPENEIAKFANELSVNKFPISTIGKIMCFDSGKLGKPHFVKIMTHKDVKIESLNIERAKKFISAATDSKFKKEFITSRYLIDAVIDLYKENDVDKIFEAIRKLSSEIVDEIQKAKPCDKSAIIKNALNSLMSA